MDYIYDADGNRLMIASEGGTGSLPIVTIDGTIPSAKSEGDLPVIIKYISDAETFKSFATIKVQGDSSQYYPKKNYTIKLFSDASRSEKDKHSFRGWNKTNKFVLKANWIDHSHARNIVNARLWTQIYKSRSDYNILPAELKDGNIAIDGFPVKVYSNGIYQGLYTWNLPKDALYGLDEDIVENSMMQGDTNKYDGSILFRASTDPNNKWSDELRDTKSSTIINAWNRVLDFVYTSNDTTFVANFELYFDKTSIIDQYIFLIVALVVDNIGKNQIFFTYNATKWYGGMYDLDGTWGLPPWRPQQFGWYLPTRVFQDEYSAVYETESHATNLLYERVGELFADDIKRRYWELRSGSLSANNIVTEFDKFISEIEPHVYADDYASTTAGGAYTDIPLASTNNFYQIKQFVLDRLAYVDEFIGEPEEDPTEEVMSLSNGKIVGVLGNCNTNISDSNFPNGINIVDTSTNRRSYVVTSGVSSYKKTSNYEDSGYYPIPVPEWADHVSVETTPADARFYTSFVQYDGATGKYGAPISSNTISWTNAPFEKDLTNPGNMYMVPVLNVDTVYNPSEVVITFTKKSS